MRLKAAVLAAALLLAAGCASVPFPATELTATTPATGAQLVAGLWSAGTRPLMISQSALFELHGMRVPVTGLMRLDPAGGTARLVGMNDMGVKLYDISVDATSSKANFVIPELERYPGFAGAVALSVRRIYLAPLPTAADGIEVGPKSYVLSRKAENGAAIRFLLGGAERQLLEKSVRGDAESWLVRYYQYRPYQAGLFPGGIVLDDERAGYRLTLWTDKVETDE